MAQVQDRILPHVQVRAFLPSERDDAMAWVSQPLDKAERDGPEPLPEPTPLGPRLIRSTRPDGVAFAVNGRIPSEDMGSLLTVFDEAVRAHERVRVLDCDGVTLETLRNEALWSLKRRGLEQVERYALVCGPGWMETVARWFTPMVRIQTRHFA